MFRRRRTTTKSDQYWRERERRMAKAQAMEASFFLLVFTLAMGFACWWLGQ